MQIPTLALRFDSMPIAWFFPLLFTLSTLCSQPSRADDVAAPASDSPSPQAVTPAAISAAISAATPAATPAVSPSPTSQQVEAPHHDAAAASVPASFDTGLAAFQKGDLNQARAIFQMLLKADPSRVAVLYNLGLTEQKSGKRGLALALWRKAQREDPHFAAAARAIAFITPQLEHPEISHDVVLWETWRSALLVNQSLAEYLGLCALLLLLSGFATLRYVGKRRRSLLDDKPLPGLPLSAILGAVFFVVSLVLSIAKIVDSNEVRGTVLPKSVSAKSAPDENGTPLFDLYEGLEVIVRQSHAQWIQVEYPGGSTGWIPRSAVFDTDQDPSQDPGKDLSKDPKKDANKDKAAL